ncbi:hypothetical protein B0H10DRAFT_1941463 [Mycena sp. CBHHK59/15]|nr:hypothetical protein B0H10DRAFT_1941463 [Mycena sp. CBHHK59/15]
MSLSTKVSTGPPQALISCIEYLQKLLLHLPTTLPLDPPDSLYQFYLDEDRVADGGVFPTASRALELSFRTWKNGGSNVWFVEQGREGQWGIHSVKGVGSLGVDSVEAETDGMEDELHESPATKRRKNDTPIVINSDSDTDLIAGSSRPSAPSRQTLTPDIAIPSTSNVNLTDNKQATLANMGWQGWAPGAEEAHFKEMSALHCEQMEEVTKRDRQRELGAVRQRRHRAKLKAEKGDSLEDDDNANVVLM